MKNLLFVFGSTILKNLIFKSTESALQNRADSIPTLNTPYVLGLAKKYAVCAGVAYLFTLFFVMGTTMAIFSVAQSFDLFGIFVPGAVFFSGIGLALISLAAIGICVNVVKKNSPVKDKIYVARPQVDTGPSSPADYALIAKSFLHGLVNGWKQESARKTAAYPETPFAGSRDVYSVDPVTNQERADHLRAVQ